jgi:hypothetical protein
MHTNLCILISSLSSNVVFVATWCDWTKSHSNSMNTTGFKVSFFRLIVVNSRQLFVCLQWKLFCCYCKECMGRQPCLFVCYGGHELHRTMDGGRSDYIEEGLRN